MTLTCTAFSAACELQQSHPPSPVLVGKTDQESSIRCAGHMHDGVCVDIVEKPDDRFGPMGSGSPASAVQLSDSTVVRTQGGGCESDTQISSKGVEKNFAESPTKWMLSSLPSGTSDGSPDTEDAALGPANIDVNSSIEPMSTLV